MTNFLILGIGLLLVQCVFVSGYNGNYNDYSSGSWSWSSSSSSEEDYYQYYYYDNNTSLSIPLTDDNSCTRTCVLGAAPKTCYYKFVVEWYTTMSRACHNCPSTLSDCYQPHCVFADGWFKPVMVVNRRLPGPRIQVCHGDKIVVDVENRMHSEELTIHWHGIHQTKSPYMDGVPFVTQCPVESGTTFRYNFLAENLGTNWWHSHSGNQRGDGFAGALIVRQPTALDPQKPYYDYDLPQHLILITDWTQGTTDNYYDQVVNDMYEVHIHSILVNGLGYVVNENFTSGIMPPRFTVQKGYRYRFRIISTGVMICPMEISVDNHTLTVISSDGYDFEPITVNSLVIYAGERFDFVINANKNIGHYWMRFRGFLMCGLDRAHQAAILSYQGASNPNGLPTGALSYDAATQAGLQLNPMNENMWKSTSIVLPSLNAVPQTNQLSNPDPALKETPDYKFYIDYDFYNISNPIYYNTKYYNFNQSDPTSNLRTPQLNYITFKMPQFALLPQRDQITPNMLCNTSTVSNCQTNFCYCTYTLQVRLGSVIEIIMIDKGADIDGNHPFHLHGHNYRFVGTEKLGLQTTLETVKAMDQAGLLQRNLKNPPIKDTASVPDGGYSIFRWQAINPGYWFYHCHIEFHVGFGMVIVFKVGEDKDMLPVPPHFPKCGSYVPPYY